MNAIGCERTKVFFQDDPAIFENNECLGMLV